MWYSNGNNPEPTTNKGMNMDNKELTPEQKSILIDALSRVIMGNPDKEISKVAEEKLTEIMKSIKVS